MINYCLGYTRDGRPCKDPETIKQRLIGANLIIFTQDFDLTPYDFKKPVKPKVTIIISKLINNLNINNSILLKLINNIIIEKLPIKPPNKYL